jgi:hypothetical protein
VPLGELIFLEQLPRRVEAVMTALGRRVDGAVMSLSSSTVTLVVHVESSQRQLIQVGDEARIDEEALGIDTTGEVVAVGEPEVVGDNAGLVPVIVHPGDNSDVLVGRSLRVTIPIETTGSAALVVPEAALYSRSDGTTVVDVRAAGRRRTVRVRPSLSADGLVAVKPLAGALAEGDDVIIGDAR